MSLANSSKNVNIYNAEDTVKANVRFTNNSVIAGEDAAPNNAGFYNVFLGYGVAKDTTQGNRQIFIGMEAGKFATGDDNLLIGASAGRYMTTGARNVMLGNNTGYFANGNNNVIIGYDHTNVNAYNESSNNVGIGYKSFTTGY